MPSSYPALCLEHGELIFSKADEQQQPQQQVEQQQQQQQQVEQQQQQQQQVEQQQLLLLLQRRRRRQRRGRWRRRAAARCRLQQVKRHKGVTTKRVLLRPLPPVPTCREKRILPWRQHGVSAKRPRQPCGKRRM